MTFNFDTGSDLFWFPLTNCTGCASTPKTYSIATGGATISNPVVRDGIEYLDGTHANGTVMSIQIEIGGQTIPLIQGVGVDDFQSNGDQEYDGLIGLTPSVLGDHTELLIDKLYDNSLIPNKMFSINFQNMNGDTYIYFGGYEADKLDSDIVWVPLGD